MNHFCHRVAAALVVTTFAAQAHSQAETDLAPRAEDTPPAERDAPLETAPAPRPAAGPTAAAIDPKARQASPPVAAVDDGAAPVDGAAGDGSAPQFDPILVIFAEYVLSLRNDATGTSDWFHQFELPRAFAGLGVAWEVARAEVLLESVRSASEGALVGVDGDSIVPRFREAWLGVDAWNVLDVRGGLVPTLVLPAVESSFAFRALTATGMERAAILSPADLGALVRARFPEKWGWVGVEAANGDGYTRRELNRGKNVEVAAEVHPLAFDDGTAPLTIILAYTAGSRGVGLAKSNRLTGAIAWRGEWVRAGGAATWADGLLDVSDRQALVLEGFAKVEKLPPIPRLIVGANVASFLRDLDVSGDVVTTVSGAAGARIAPPLAAYLAVDGLLYGGAAADALPARDDARFRVIGELSL